MNLKKRLLQNSDIYLIISINAKINSRVLFKKITQTIGSGVKIIQIRCKHINDSDFLKFALEIKKITYKAKILFIVNDRIDIALACRADGVHLGQNDLSVQFAKKLLGKSMIIGKSAHNIKQALLAQSERVDYIGFGPIFKTKTKSDQAPIGCDQLLLINKKIKIPVFSIGGINSKNIRKLTAYNVKKVAVSRAILGKNNIKKAIRVLQNSLKA